MVDVLFLSPPRRRDGSQYLFNNASLGLASYVVRHGMTARVEPLMGSDWRQRLDRAIREWKPRWAAISCKWWDTVYGATQVAEQIRRDHPQVKLVTGGQTATSFAEDLLTRTAFDAVVTGDAEQPLLQLLQGDPRCNLWLRHEGRSLRLPQTYVQPRQGGESLRLLDDLTELAPSELLYQAGFTAPYVWTGKGCQSACSYCSGSAYGHKKLFGRTGFQYRPVDEVLADIQALSPWTRNSLMFDFDPVQDPDRENYYLAIARQLPARRYHAAFYCWTLPSQGFLEEASQLFASILVSLDAQTYSQPLRQRLARRNQLKPFASDLELMQRLEAMRALPNVHGVVYGILGLQTETAYDVELGESFMNYLQDAYIDVLQPNGVYITPLSIEPNSLLDRDPQKFGMVRVRHGFDDYYAFTRLRWEDVGGAIWEGQYRSDLPHPYGIFQQADGPERVYHDFQRLVSGLRQKSHRWEAEKSLQSLERAPEYNRLVLKSRSIFQDDWRLILWAAGDALARGVTDLVIDTRQSHLRVPPLEVFPFEDQFDWADEQWQAFQQARQEGRLKLHFELGPTTDLGFLA